MLQKRCTEKVAWIYGLHGGYDAGTGSPIHVSCFCAVSGEVPQDPVVSKTTGHVYERRMIEKEIARTGQCPLTGADLSADDLISVKGWQM